MGIKDLLRFLKPYIKPIHINKYAGKRVGIDAYSWLHKGAYSCSLELCLDSNGERKLRYLDYFMHRINLLRHYNITPVVVFDGGNIPCKSATEHERHRRRKANHDLAMEKLKEGNAKAATELFQRAISITPAIAHQLIQILRSENIDFVVAPYEADAQLAYLSSLEVEKGGIVAVITEDSDLIAYGCKATVFKMDRHGNGEELVLDNVLGSKTCTCTPSFQSFDKELFIGMCVLAGCDFLPSVPGIGIAKAYSMVSKYRNLDRVLSVLKFEKGSQMPEDYSKYFRQAVAVFQHALIYDGDAKKLEHIKPLPQMLLQFLDGELDFLGPHIFCLPDSIFHYQTLECQSISNTDPQHKLVQVVFVFVFLKSTFFSLTIVNYIREIPPSVATAIAEGCLDPVTMEAFNFFPSSGHHQIPVVRKTSSRLKNSKINLGSREETCFMLFAPHKTMEKETTDILKQDSVPGERNYLREGAALQNLLLPLEVNETIRVSDDIPLKIPNNNPFKKRKLDEMQLDQIKSNTEEVLVLIDDEKSDVLCITPDIIPPTVPENNNSRKRNIHRSQLDQKQSISKGVSVITEVEDSNLYITTELQESVDSKPKKNCKGKVRIKTENKKASNCMGSVKKSTSILNFFPRV